MNKCRITYPNNKEVREYLSACRLHSKKSRTTNAVFRDMLDFHAYSYEYNVLGSSNYGGFTMSDVVKFAETYPAFNSMHYDNFSWTKHFNKPF